MPNFYYYSNSSAEEKYNFFYPRYRNSKAILKDYDSFCCSKSDILVFDTETTGFSPTEDDILQLSIINGDGIEIFNKYFKPELKPYWGDLNQMNEKEQKALSINGINADSLEKAMPISSYVDVLNDIFNQAQLIVGYNKIFDLNFLISKGINSLVNKKGFDPLCVYPVLFPKQTFLSPKGNYSYSLSNVCNFNNYEWQEDAHNSLGDVKATLFVFEKCQKRLCELEKNLNNDLNCSK